MERLRERGLIQVGLIVPATDEEEAQQWARKKRAERGLLLPRDKK
jgi:hypothetical protein